MSIFYNFFDSQEMFDVNSSSTDSEIEGQAAAIRRLPNYRERINWSAILNSAEFKERYFIYYVYNSINNINT